MNLFKKSRRELKILIYKKKFDHATKLNSSLYDNPKRFRNFVKFMTKQKTIPHFLQDGQTFITKPKCKANMLNNFFQSVFSWHAVNTQPTTSPDTPNIQPTTSSVASNNQASTSPYAAKIFILTFLFHICCTFLYRLNNFRCLPCISIPMSHLFRWKYKTDHLVL